jgi:hypothetical protein
MLSARFAVFARGSVEAGIGKSEALDQLAAEDVRFNDLLDICFRNVSVPDCVWVDHDVRTMLALIEAARLIGANFSFQAAFCQLLLESFL